MPVYDVLCGTGEVTREFVELLLRITRTVVRFRNFPPLDPHHRWDDDAFNDLVQDFYCARPIGERLAVLLAGTSNEAAFVSGLETAVTRHIQSALRRTPRGRIARTVKGIIEDEPRFEYTEDHVCLAVAA